MSKGPVLKGEQNKKTRLHETLTNANFKILYRINNNFFDNISVFLK